jgi:hypothetical protein
MKTTFGPGVIVTSKWLNGAKKLHFDGLDQDWHYDPINRSDIQRGGEDGLDNVYVTMTTDQEYRATGGVTGRKSFMSQVQFGDVLSATGQLAPLSWSTNAKFNIGGSSLFSEKYANLQGEDLITKEILNEYNANFPAIDEGFF